MEKIEQKNFLLEIAEQQKEIIYTDNKTFAKLDWLKPWSKNPRTIEKKNLDKLKTHINELGLYKPLIVYLEKDNATILGGNMRYKAIKELHEKDTTGKFDYVWVSVVNADNDTDKLKYALSDNFSAGEYTREKLMEVVKLDQTSMFDAYDISWEEKKTLREFVDDLALSENEIKLRTVKKDLKALGINDETIKTLETMTTYNKINEDLPDVELKGCITGQKFPLLFWVDDEVLFENLKNVYGTGHKDRYDIDKLINLTEKQLGIYLPTSEDELVRLAKEIAELTVSLKDHEELGGNWEKIEDKRSKVVETFKNLFLNTYPDEGGQMAIN
jgi:ParB-like chromosome segregation protein Spo0J